MSILDKVMFWKKKDEFSDLGSDPFGKGSLANDPLASNNPPQDNLAFGNEFNPSPQPSFGQQSPPKQQFPQPSSFQQQPPPFQQPSSPQSFSPKSEPNYQQQDLASKNMEIISTKLDALRASVEIINQRLANLESIARGNDENKKRYY
ncbi:hypothetical protein ISS07_06435 [Candidatus Woesearchaeota archaeon]|nr:hypothetical protein [Candidatus Woesearchaeota archaeon]